MHASKGPHPVPLRSNCLSVSKKCNLMLPIMVMVVVGGGDDGGDGGGDDDDGGGGDNDVPSQQGGRTWQPFVGSKSGNENFRQTRIYNFRVKCVVFARNCKFAKLTQ